MGNHANIVAKAFVCFNFLGLFWLPFTKVDYKQVHKAVLTILYAVSLMQKSGCISSGYFSIAARIPEGARLLLAVLPQAISAYNISNQDSSRKQTK